MNTAAPGKAVLAFLDENKMSDIIDQHGLVERTENTITDREELADELTWIREHNYALNDEEQLMSMCSIAAHPSTERNEYGVAGDLRPD